LPSRINTTAAQPEGLTSVSSSCQLWRVTTEPKKLTHTKTSFPCYGPSASANRESTDWRSHISSFPGKGIFSDPQKQMTVEVRDREKNEKTDREASKE